MGKPTLKALKQKRDGGGGAVMVIPHCVLNSTAYLTLSGQAVKLLYDVAMQYNMSNNGALLASFRYMSEKRGWRSSDALQKAKQELISHELMLETVKGQRPNKASWYGLTWLALDSLEGLEISARNWPRGAYARWAPAPTERPKRAPPPPESRESYYKRLRQKNAMPYP